MSTRERIRKVVCISTGQPNDSIAAPGAGGSLAVVCPFTGSVFSTLRVSADMTGKLPIGVASLSMFPSSFSPKESLALAFGSSAKKGDTYAMLLTIRQTATAPTVHWKCHLPEAQLSTGLLVSPCGHYIVGGGASGNIYVWKSLGGVLLSTYKAHYRSVSCLAWSSCGHILVTGGADGIVHAFSLRDMVATDSSSSAIQPFRSFSHHQLPITAIKALPSGRVITGSQDGQLTIIELYSELILASIQLPHPVTSLDATAHRLFAGTQQGTIYSIDLDQYALHQSEQQGAVIVARSKADNSKPLSDRVFQMPETRAEESSVSYQAEFRGHDRAVTALAIISDYEEEWLVSGDQAGVVRVWDMASRACVRTIHLWSPNRPGSSIPKSNTSLNALRSVATITVLDESIEDDKGSGSILDHANHPIQTGRNQASKNPHSVVNQIKTLQRFTDDNALAEAVLVKLSLPKRMFWHGTCDAVPFDVRPAIQKRLKTSAGAGDENKDKREIERLRQELATVKEALEQQSAA